MADKKNTSLANHFLNTLMNEQAFIGKNLFSFGRDTIGEAKVDINYLQDFFKNIMEGNNSEQLLDFIDVDSLNKSFADTEKVASEYSARGGSRAAILGNLPFEKNAEIQRMIQGVKAKSPDALMQLAQLLGTIGTNAIGQGQTAYGLNLEAVMGQLGLHEKEKDRKAALIGNIIGAAGSIAGAVAGGMLGGGR